MFNHPDFVLTLARDRRAELDRRLVLVRLRSEAAPLRRRRRFPRFFDRPASVPTVAPLPR